ncbi:hypothetical protein H175_16p10 (plasmid) [Bacillus thuringiensis serovar thuringiensis str. IS5056]|uniref:M48 family metalloprotease n=1 Tax=Bacillus thuringiensis TaxID=1428 RepID=UPI0002B75FDF|nr:M48 family metalloprotease [Bacillus thuringiensis]AGG04406.1 hypothetical protein H175_16p10 [Bacillus thuringiensis serovar thuringiensis str. IS5056]
MTKGLLKTANEEELAGILAHELGHLKYGDIDTPTAKAASPTPYGVTDGILE